LILWTKNMVDSFAAFESCFRLGTVVVEAMGGRWNREGISATTTAPAAHQESLWQPLRFADSQ